MAMRSLSSIITEIEKARDKKEQIRLLQQHSCPALKTILGYAFDPHVFWLIPETEPPYKPLSANADQEGSLYAETRKFIYFVRSQESMNLSQSKREQIFIQMLEGIDPEDAKLVLRVRAGKLRISRPAIREAFPKLTENWDKP